MTRTALSAARLPVIAVAAFAALLRGIVTVAAAPPPRLVPAHDAMGVYRLSQQGRPDQTWRVRFDAADRLVRATSLAGTPTALTVLLDLPAGRAELVLAQMHALVDVPGLAGVIRQATEPSGARFTALGTARIAGHRCTRYLVLRRHGSGTACITRGGIVLAATGHDGHGSVTLRALSVDQAPQPPSAFAVPAGYAHVTLPPAMLAQLLGG